MPRMTKAPVPINAAAITRKSAICEPVVAKEFSLPEPELLAPLPTTAAPLGVEPESPGVVTGFVGSTPGFGSPGGVSVRSNLRASVTVKNMSV